MYKTPCQKRHLQALLADMDLLVNQSVQPNVVPWGPVPRRPVGNPVVGGQPSGECWSTLALESGFEFDRPSRTWRQHWPNRHVIDPGSLHVNRQRSTDINGNPIIIETTYWTSYGKPHFKTQILQGVPRRSRHDHDQRLHPERRPGSRASTMNGTNTRR